MAKFDWMDWDEMIDDVKRLVYDGWDEEEAIGEVGSCRGLNDDDFDELIRLWVGEAIAETELLED